jgi:hypothetical protein
MIRRSILVGLAALGLAAGAQAEVLGPCGTPEAMTPASATPAASATAGAAPALSIAPVPLPGQQAPNFELQAVVGDDEVKTIKLSDYDGKWRVICFYPADFTFV